MSYLLKVAFVSKKTLLFRSRPNWLDCLSGHCETITWMVITKTSLQLVTGLMCHHFEVKNIRLASYMSYSLFPRPPLGAILHNSSWTYVATFIVSPTYHCQSNVCYFALVSMWLRFHLSDLDILMHYFVTMHLCTWVQACLVETFSNCWENMSIH